MPQTAILFLAGALAIGGMPPLNGFISEFLIYSGIISGINTAGISQITLMILTFAGMSLIGGISILTFTKTFGTIFLGIPRLKTDHEPVEVSYLMLIPQYIILAFMLFIAFFPGLFITLAGKVLSTNSFPSLHFETAGIQGYLSVMKNISLTSMIFLLFVGLMFFIRWSISRKTVNSIDSTWGCAYGSPNSRMQYTGKSYSKTFGKLLNFVMIEKKGYPEIEKKEIFPAARKYHSFYLDFFETRIINPVLHIITRFINLFQFIQNGRIQAYVIYGIVFILAIFIGTILNFWH
jgi:NADH:ubiquinone oxidoreductase subunit 5 (subunit L)/multisubunit Na+/H+ antiporter MnhA subunit